MDAPSWKKTRFGWGGVVDSYTILTDESDQDSKPFLVDRNGNLISRVDYGSDSLERDLQRDYLEAEMRRPRPGAVKAPVDIQKLARDLNHFDWDFDTYGYYDVFDDIDENGLSYRHELDITKNLMDGDIDHLISGTMYALEAYEECNDTSNPNYAAGQDIMRRLMMFTPNLAVYDRKPKSKFSLRSLFKSRKANG